MLKVFTRTCTYCHSVLHRWQHLYQSIAGIQTNLAFAFMMCRCILLALQALHAAGWGHGDLCWENVILITGGHFTVIDLESVVSLGSDVQEEPLLTWEPPAEALDGDGTFTSRSDLYMLGMMLEQAWIVDRDGCDFRDRLLEKTLVINAALGHPWLKQGQQEHN